MSVPLGNIFGLLGGRSLDDNPAPVTGAAEFPSTYSDPILGPEVPAAPATIQWGDARTYFSTAAPYAAEVALKYRLPPELVLAVPANEQGFAKPWPGNNGYGIKGSAPGTGAGGPQQTWEVINGKRVNIVDRFRQYDSPEQSMEDFARFLHENPRYATALAYYRRTGDADGMVRLIHDNGKGYATDPNWARQVSALMRQARPYVESRQEGGIIDEPVVGVGQHTGRVWTFGETGPETVVPGPRADPLAIGSAQDDELEQRLAAITGQSALPSLEDFLGDTPSGNTEAVRAPVGPERPISEQEDLGGVQLQPRRPWGSGDENTIPGVPRLTDLPAVREAALGRPPTTVGGLLDYRQTLDKAVADTVLGQAGVDPETEVPIGPFNPTASQLGQVAVGVLTPPTVDVTGPLAMGAIGALGRAARPIARAADQVIAPATEAIGNAARHVVSTARDVGERIPPFVRQDAANAAGGAAFGAVSEDLQATAEGRDVDPAVRLGRAALGALGGVAAGRMAKPLPEGVEEVGMGFVPQRRRLPTRAEVAERTAQRLREVRLPEGAQPIALTTNDELARLRLDKFPDDLQEQIAEGARSVAWARDQRRGVLSDRTVADLANSDMRSVDQLISSGTAGRAYNPEETVALRNTVASQAARVRDLAGEVATARADGVTPDLLIARQMEEGLKLHALIKVAEGARAEAGRALRAYRQYARLIEVSPEDAIQRIYQKAGGAERAGELADTYQAIVRDGNVIDLSKFWAKVEHPPVTIGDWVTALRYNSMLSGPATHLVNAASNMVDVPYRLAGDTAEAIATGNTQRLGPMYRGVATGIRAGVEGAWQTLLHGISEAQALRGDVPRDLSARIDNRLGRVLALGLEAPSRALGAADQFFHQLHYHINLGKLAAGRSNDPAAVARLLSDPPDEMAKLALEAADRATFHGRMGDFGTAIQKMRSVNPVVGNIAVPFLSTVYHITGRGIDRSPLGAIAVAKDLGLDALDRWMGKEGGRVAGNPAPLNERVRDALIGTTVAGMAASWAQEGKLSGSGPESPIERDMLRAEGWQPFSVKVGDKWVSYANWGPAAVPLAMAAAWGESGRYAKPTDTKLDQWGDMARRFAEVFTEQTYLQGVGNLYRAISDPERYGGQFITTLPQTFVPYGSALNAAGQSRDEFQRRADPPQDVGLWESTRQQMASRNVPLSGGWRLNPRETVPVAQDPLGRPLPNVRAGADAVNPLRVSRVRPDDIISAFRDVGINLGRPPTSLKVGDEDIDLTPDQRRVYQQAMGEYIETRFDAIPSTAPDYDKRLARLYREARGAAEREARSEVIP